MILTNKLLILENERGWHISSIWYHNDMIILTQHSDKPLHLSECLIFLPFFGRPLPLPSRLFRSSSLLLGLVGAVAVPLTTSPLSLRESPLPESLEEFFLSLRLAFALRRASWMLLLDKDSQLPLISLLMFLLDTTVPPLSSSPETNESLRPSASVGLQMESWLNQKWGSNFNVLFMVMVTTMTQIKSRHDCNVSVCPEKKTCYYYQSWTNLFAINIYSYIYIYKYITFTYITEQWTVYYVSICRYPLNVSRAGNKSMLDST